jgi:hypothetical protein
MIESIDKEKQAEDQGKGKKKRLDEHATTTSIIPT